MQNCRKSENCEILMQNCTNLRKKIKNKKKVRIAGYKLSIVKKLELQDINAELQEKSQNCEGGKSELLIRYKLIIVKYKCRIAEKVRTARGRKN